MIRNTPSVAVVTPFYNEERYLGECIESVLGQTYENFEYILVDNHSTDRSPDIAREYARRDRRIRIVQPPEHLHQLPNFNFGLRSVSEQAVYCKIVLGDDWIYPTCLELLVALAQAHPSAGLLSGFTMLERNVYLSGLHPTEPFVAGREIGRRFLRDGMHVFGSPTAHLFRADLVRSRAPFFCEQAHPFADVDACLEVVSRSDFAFVHQVLSFTRRSNDSITTRRQRYTNTLLLTRYAMLLRHGPRFFDPDELADCLRELSATYYRSVGDGFWRMMPADWWRLQRGCISGTGASFSMPRALAAIAVELLTLLLNPLESARRVRDRLRAVRAETSG
jgi:glycosyltransferase involved in cell wall biosynthesis